MAERVNAPRPRPLVSDPLCSKKHLGPGLDPGTSARCAKSNPFWNECTGRFVTIPLPWPSRYYWENDGGVYDEYYTVTLCHAHLGETS